jgi:coenzyme Q-binding protein COQ10
MFALVADVEQYPAFLPWVVATRIKTRADDGFTADVLVGFNGLRERFTSRVVLAPETRTISVDYLEGPFAHLTNLWRFAAAGEGGCAVDFDIDFAFRTRALELLMGSMFARSVAKMTEAFELRAAALYGVTATRG